MSTRYLICTITLISFTILFNNTVFAQDCTLPTYDVTVNYSPGVLAFDILSALQNDPFVDLSTYSNCTTYTDLEASSSCLSVVFEGESCNISVWQILISPNASDECCNTFTVPYGLTYIDLDGSSTTCYGLININIECAHDCGIIDFTDGTFFPIQAVNGGQTTGPTECVKICENSTIVAFSPIYGNSGINYSWNVQGGTIISGGNTSEATIEWGAFGVGNISVTIHNPLDPSFTPIVYDNCIEILEGPEALFISTGYSCLGAPIQFSNASSSGTVNYFWDYGDGTSYSSSGPSSPAHTYTTPGIYDVTLTVYTQILGPEGNVICMCSDTYTDQVEVDSLIGPDIICISTLCEGDTSTYSTTANCSGYLWSVFDALGAPVIFTGQGTSEIFVEWGLGPYGIVELEVSGCTPQYCTTPTSVMIPIIPANGDINGANLVCEGDVVMYDLTKWVSVDYDWSVTGGTIVSQDNQTIAVQWYTSGIIEVSYTSSFLQGIPGNGVNDCMGFASLNVEVRPKFSITPSSIDICKDTPVLFSMNAVSGGGFNWSNSGVANVNSATSTSYDVSFPNSGVYSVTADVDAASITLYCNTTATSWVTVHDVPMPTSITGALEVCSDSPSYIYEVAGSSGLTAAWTASAANSGSGLPSAMPFAGLYTDVTWGQSGPYTLDVQYMMTTLPYCMSPAFSLNINEITLDPGLAVTSPDAPCANESAGYFLNGVHPEAILNWTVTPSQYGSVVSGQGTNAITVQWNDFIGTSVNATVTCNAELCSESIDYPLGINLNRAIVPIVIGTDFCVGTTGELEVTNNASFTAYDWGGFSATTYLIYPTNAGEFIVNTVDVNGCTSSGGTSIDILPAPMLNLTTNGPGTLVNGIPSSTQIVAPTNSNYSYVWTCCGSSTVIGTGATITHNWLGVSLPNSYNYSLTITEISTGCTNTENITIHEALSSTGQCVPEAYTLTPSASPTSSCDTWNFNYTANNVNSINWNFDDLSYSSLQSPSHVYNEIGYYYVELHGLVDNTSGTGTCYVNEYVIVEVAMVAQFDVEVACTPLPSNTPEVCLIDETAYLPNTSVSNYDFNLGGNTAGTSPFCVSNLTLGSSYTASLTATSSSGCTSEYNELVVIPGPVLISPVPDLCLEEAATFSASCAGAVSFDWNFGDASVGASSDAIFDGNDPNHSYAQNTFTNLLNGPYSPTVSVTATHVSGCEFTDAVTVNVFDLPQISTVASFDGDFKFCEGGDEILYMNPIMPAGTYNVTWWLDNTSNIVSIGNPTYLASVEGEYGVILTDPITGCEINIPPVLVQKWPNVPSTITGPTAICEGECVDLLSPSGPYSYNWSSMNLGVLGTTPSVSICSYMIPLDDMFLLKVTDNISGCFSESSLFIELAAIPNVQIDTQPDPPCEGAVVSIFVDPVNPLFDYVWTGGVTGQVFTTSSEGNYTVVATDPITGCKGSTFKIVNPCPNLCDVPVGCYTACDTGKTVCGPSGLDSYEWNFIPAGSTASPVVYGSTQCITMNDAGDYTLTATNLEGCSKTSGVLEMEFIDCDSCQFDFDDMIDLQLLSLGTSLYSTDIDGDGVNEDVSCCVWSINPIISTVNGATPTTLCMDIFWGDGTQDLNLPLGFPIEHCYTEGCSEYPISVKIKCCDDGSNAYGYNATAYCECVPDCYIRNAFWETITDVSGSDKCHLELTGTQFLGPDMVSHQNPEYIITGFDNLGNSVNISSLTYNFSLDLNPGIYEVCRTIEGVSSIGEICTTEHCHEVVVDCCGDPVINDGCYDCPNFEASIHLQSLGSSIDANGAACCSYGLTPQIIQGCGIDIFDLCININWGDGSQQLNNMGFAAGYTHCFYPGEYNVTMEVFCCDEQGDLSPVWSYTETVICNDGIDPCELSNVDFEWGSNSNCTNGCDEVWFCATGIEPSSDICLSWDFGDGNIYNPSLPDCPIHCYTSGGNKNVCLTAYCCADGINQASSTTVCNTIEVDCGFVDVECTGDYDLDGFIGVIDLLELLGAYGGACE